MAVTYVGIDGEQVSAQWAVVLHDMRQAGVRFAVNEGHRTMARQLYFWNLYRSGRGNLAAFPSPNAPHIRTGRIDHAIDFSNDTAVMAWLASKDLHPVRTVRGESWHIEITAARLQAYATSHGNPVIRPFRRNNPDAVRRVQKLLRDRGFHSVKVNGRYDRASRSAVRRFQHQHGLKSDGVVGPATWRALHG